MKIYTKEWHQLLDGLGTAEMFEPIIDKEYSDEEIAALHQDMLDKYLQEEQDAYDEPPVLGFDDDEQEYLIELKEYEEREPFDREEAAREFEEEYRDNLEEPDTDIPEWVRKSVDPRLLALWLLPEGVYKKLREDELEKQAKFDELDEKVDRLVDEYEDSMPEEFEGFTDIMDEAECGYIMSAGMKGPDYELEIADWDDDGEQFRRIVTFKNAEMIENEEPVISVETDEDGDVETDCDILDHELYAADGRIEVHMLLDNEEKGLKYVTLRCGDIVMG